jgi:hypothetical protein
MVQHVPVASLWFLGGPWDARTVDSQVTNPPARLKPDPDEPGEYVRVETDTNSGTATYIWNAGFDAD